MVLKYVKEQIFLGQLEARKIYGKINNADLHTKPLRSSSFQHMAHKIRGQPAPIPASTSTSLVDVFPDPPTEIVSLNGMDVTSQPNTETKRVHLDPTDDISGLKRRRKHLLRYITSPVIGSDGGYGCG